ncbi:hypothetical protein [Brevibacillus sp. AY1]|uniref:hypothetical protein n=1 Tax=Brevibacillus sp. AY1 TaxID=2807621 RepID=UPI00245871A5|nr:hypothetical protein [Brevibacillus sp. AY1]MDH4618513.1 hypothetical protein [Brevibacillus sp. AY1]
MKHWKQGIVATVLLMGMVMPFGAQAADHQVQPKAGTYTSVPEQENNHHGHHKFRMRMSAHQKMYMTLLAEKYTPSQVAEWQTVLKEREKLITELKAARETSGQEEKVEEKGKAPESADRKEKQGEDTDRRAKMEKFRKVHEEFDTAIETEDAAKIKEVLPKLLEQLKAKNERMAKKLAETKK